MVLVEEVVGLFENVVVFDVIGFAVVITWVMWEKIELVII